MSSHLFSKKGVVLSLAIAGTSLCASCDRKETASAGAPAAARPELTKSATASLGTKLGDLAKAQAAIAKDLATVSDAKAAVVAIHRVTESMGQWLALAPSLEVEEDPDGVLTATANEAGKALGANYQTALKTSEPFKDDPEVAAALEKLLARQKELMK